MLDYKSVVVRAKQGFGGAKGTVETAVLDKVLNEMAQQGWKLTTIESLEHHAGTGDLLCVFEKRSD